MKNQQAEQIKQIHQEEVRQQFVEHRAEIIKDHGHFIQAVDRGISYTIGLNKKYGFELISGLLQNGVFEDSQEILMRILNITDRGILPEMLSWETDTVFQVREKDFMRFGFVEVADPERIKKLFEVHCPDWNDFYKPDELKKVFIVVVGDENNCLPWEDSYIPFGQEFTI